MSYNLEYLRGFARYPESKEVAGPKYWGTMHNAATQLPDTLSQTQVNTFHQWLLYTASHFVCPSCKDAIIWLKGNRPAGRTRENMIAYVCRLHNFVNDKTGKLLHDCGSITSEECKDCNYQPTESQNQYPMEEVLNDSGDVPQAMGEFQQAALRVFEALCERERVPVPPIDFVGCPEYPHRSCTVFHGGDVTQAVVKLDPETFGLYSVVHEFLHYLRKLRGEDAANEYEIGTLAQAIIAKEFPHLDSAAKVNKNPSVDYSSSSMTPVMHETFPNANAYLPIKPTIRQDRMESVYKRFPLYAKRVADAQKTQTPTNNPEMINIRESRGAGFLSGLDGIFRPIADAVGIPSHVANTMHMSNTIGVVANTVIESGTSPLGTSIVSLVGSAALFLAGVFGKHDIGIEDRKVLYGIVSNLFNNNIAVLGNQKTRAQAMRGADIAGYALSRLDFDLFFKAFFNDPATLSTGGVQSAPTNPGSIPPDQYQGYGRAPGTGTSSGGSGGGGTGGSGGAGLGFGGGGSGMPVGGGVGGHGFGGPDFDPYGNQLRGEPLERQQQRTFKEAVANRRNPININAPIGMEDDTPSIYSGPDLSIPELGDLGLGDPGNLKRKPGYEDMNQVNVWPYEEEEGY